MLSRDTGRILDFPEHLLVQGCPKNVSVISRYWSYLGFSGTLVGSRLSEERECYLAIQNVQLILLSLSLIRDRYGLSAVSHVFALVISYLPYYFHCTAIKLTTTCAYC